ncbi:MAG: hypothetical protein HY960_12540 [Ignavibacteriae bacterium]|nr:hypothetical protein [Ignavibacteriota bacterium]
MIKKTMHRKVSGFTAFHQSVEGTYVEIEGEKFYKISNYNQMQPFFMSIVSDSDHWMFISSNGGLTAGRKNPDNALFPYYTDDKIHDSHEHTGSKTILLVSLSDKQYLWEPFSIRCEGIYRVENNLYKNIYGNKIVYEEINHDLSVTFRYSWFNSKKYGFIKRAQLSNHNHYPIKVEILDGIQNILPSDLSRRFQQEYSTLIDGYKKNELEVESGLGIFALSSIPIDKAEPNEALKATIVWSVGLDNKKILLSSEQLDAFRTGHAIRQETDVHGERGAYFIHAECNVSQVGEKEWLLVADINQDARKVAEVKSLLQGKRNIAKLVMEDVALGTSRLRKIIASADGLQLTEDFLVCSRHYSNVLYNVMRGGVFDDGYTINKHDFISFIRKGNKKIAKQFKGFFQRLPEKFQRSELFFKAETLRSLDFEKLCYEYLPLTFSRRHGDPSRPWNLFSIETKDDNGEKILNYEGNWRDIFQNWEALALSYPEYVEGMITKFVNASTVDGYNPYRVTRDGFDWESINPHDEWSYIGYWGDHQVIYLVKLLEISSHYHREKIQTLLLKDIFAYANVPYRIKSYSAMLQDPHCTIDFDMNLDKEIQKRVNQIGTDGKFILNKRGEIVHVNLIEKMIVSILSKLSNFIPEAGIWMNTQRPEWNDANNALVGFGVSMVTLCYLRRYICVFRELIWALDEKKYALISEEVEFLFTSIKKIFLKFEPLLIGPVTNRQRKVILDNLGQAGSNFRSVVYKKGLSGRRKKVDISSMLEFSELSLKYIDHTIKANKREDNMYQAYTLMKVENNNEISIRNLYEMLEGQVAILSSGYLSASEALLVLDSLKKSSMYRIDQNSYMLYPDRLLPRFVEKNNLAKHQYTKSKLLKLLLKDGNRQIVTMDVTGKVHFNSEFRNKNVLLSALDNINDEKYSALVKKEKDIVVDMYERLFDHQSFTGRSGTFYKYEGLGCIYWHMVSKLLIAVQEVILQARRNNDDGTVIQRLATHYKEIKEGIGVHKSPAVYGAFPIDPYSHTPRNKGAQQPGMSGQVKEDIISRFVELGLFINDGKIIFHPELLDVDEFLKESKLFEYIDVAQEEKSIKINKGSLAFTFCQVPVVYHLSVNPKLHITNRTGKVVKQKELSLDKKTSSSIFKRDGRVRRIDVYVSSVLTND